MQKFAGKLPTGERRKVWRWFQFPHGNMWASKQYVVCWVCWINGKQYTIIVCIYFYSIFSVRKSLFDSILYWRVEFACDWFSKISINSRHLTSTCDILLFKLSLKDLFTFFNTLSLDSVVSWAQHAHCQNFTSANTSVLRDHLNSPHLLYLVFFL